jgi:hypothetical protein
MNGFTPRSNRTESAGNISPRKLGLAPARRRFDAFDVTSEPEQHGADLTTRILLTLLVGFCLTISQASPAANITARIVDEISEQGLASVRVYAHVIEADGNSTKFAGTDTDANGFVSFEIPDSVHSNEFELKAKPFNQWLTSEHLVRDQAIDWRTGRITVRVVDGNGTPLPHTAVEIHEDTGDGMYSLGCYARNLTTQGGSASIRPDSAMFLWCCGP